MTGVSYGCLMLYSLIVCTHCSVSVRRDSPLEDADIYLDTNPSDVPLRLDLPVANNVLILFKNHDQKTIAVIWSWFIIFSIIFLMFLIEFSIKLEA